MWAIHPWARRAPNHRLQSPDFFLFPRLIVKYTEWKWGDFVFFRQMKVWGGIVAVWQMRLGGLARHSRIPDISRHCQIKRPQTLEQVCSVKKWRIPARWQPPLTCDQCCKYVDRIGEIIRFHSPRSSYTLHILKHHKLKGQVNWVVFPIGLKRPISHVSFSSQYMISL